MGRRIPCALDERRLRWTGPGRGRAAVGCRGERDPQERQDDQELSDRPRATTYRILVKPGIDPRGDIARVIATADGMDLLSLSMDKASLEDVFRKLTTTSGPSGN